MLDARTLLLAGAVSAALLGGALPGRAAAALESVSGAPDAAVDPTALTAVPAGGVAQDVAYSLSNGFPIWYQDANGLKLALCLDQRVERTPGISFLPCLTAESFRGAPISFPANFGAEAFYWSATAFGTYTSSVAGQPVVGDALLVLAHEAGFASGLGVDGNQAVFGRIRIRISVPVAGTYRVIHPYGEAQYVVVVPGSRAINQTQDLGNLLGPAGAPPAGDFTVSLRDGPDPATDPFVLPPGYPGVSATPQGIVSSAPAGLGPFLVPAAPFQPVTALNGSTYLADPGTDLAPLTVPVTAGPHGNVFSIELLDPPDGVFLDGANSSQVVVLDRFQLTGKVFDDGPNLPPVANDDAAAAARGSSVVIDVVANDVDPVGARNVHGIQRAAPALGLPTDPGDLRQAILLTAPLATARGGTVRRFTELLSGKTTFLYTPAAGFTGVDTFPYVVQDTGGLISAPATVTVTVEDLAVTKAEYRARTGKWRVEGTSSDGTGNSVVLLAGPQARLAGESEVPAVVSAGAGSATLRLSGDAIEYRLAVNGIPAAEISAAEIRVGPPGRNGPVAFVLHQAFFDGEFTGEKSGRLSDAELVLGVDQTLAGIHSFSDALQAIAAGNAYVNVRTTAHPDGELRGQLDLATIGTAPVDGHGKWAFTGKSTASPGGAPASVNVVSANGIRLFGAPLRLR